jgi:hypothetical protein
LDGEKRNVTVNTELYICSPFIICSTLISGAGAARLPEVFVTDDIKASRLIYLGVSDSQSRFYGASTPAADMSLED